MAMVELVLENNGGERKRRERERKGATGMA
jgi:hypothetical protein